VTDDGIRDIPWCRCYHSEGLRLKALEDFNIGGGGCAPQLDPYVQIGLMATL
jgi:hypothetical protein